MILQKRVYCILLKNMSSGINGLGSNPGSIIIYVALSILIPLCQFHVCYMGVFMLDEENQ